MKKLILIIVTLCSTVYAGEVCEDSQTKAEEQLEIKTDVPKYLEGATITVKLKDGRESTVPAEKYKVVPRLQQFIVTKTNTTTKCHASEKNRLSMVAGKAPRNKLKRSGSGAAVSVENEYGNTVGVQYQREFELLGLPLNGGIQLQDNDSGMGLIGIDF